VAIKVTPAAEAARKWTDVTPGRQSYYESGVKGAGQDWENGAMAAKQAYKSAVSAANIDQMFAGGVKKAGQAKYVAKASTLGAARFSQGVQAAGADFQSGVEPYLTEIAGITLPARGPRGSTGNLARVTEIATKLNKKRLQLRAAGA
jgi:hypothetical protein